MPKQLIKLTKKQMLYVENEWHHAVLSFLDLCPTYDDRYNDFDFTDEEVDQIVEAYGIKPPQWMKSYWDRNPH